VACLVGGMTLRTRFLSGLVTLATLASTSLLLAGCGGSVGDTAPGADAGGDTSLSDTTPPSDTTPISDAVLDTKPPPIEDVGPDTAPKKGCPSSPPLMGAPCAPVGLVCGYGDDPRPNCRPQATCKATGWETPIGACPPPPTETCPPSLSEASGATCTTAGAFCKYGDVLCGCGNCFGGPCGGTAKWVCPDPPSNPDCPRTMPNLGIDCTKEGTSCMYGSCASGNPAGRTCKGGYWVDEPVACPLAAGAP